MLQPKFLWETQVHSLWEGLAAIVLTVKHEIVLAIIGGLFVLETSFKLLFGLHHIN